MLLAAENRSPLTTVMVEGRISSSKSFDWLCHLTDFFSLDLGFLLQIGAMITMGPDL